MFTADALFCLAALIAEAPATRPTAANLWGPVITLSVTKRTVTKPTVRKQTVSKPTVATLAAAINRFQAGQNEQLAINNGTHGTFNGNKKIKAITARKTRSQPQSESVRAISSTATKRQQKSWNIGQKIKTQPIQMEKIKQALKGMTRICKYRHKISTVTKRRKLKNSTVTKVNKTRKMKGTNTKIRQTRKTNGINIKSRSTVKS